MTTSPRLLRWLLSTATMAVLLLAATGCKKTADETPAAPTAANAAPAAPPADPSYNRPLNAEAAAGAAEFERQRRAFEERDKQTAPEGKK